MMHLVGHLMSIITVLDLVGLGDLNQFADANDFLVNHNFLRQDGFDGGCRPFGGHLSTVGFRLEVKFLFLVKTAK